MREKVQRAGRELFLADKTGPGRENFHGWMIALDLVLSLLSHPGSKAQKSILWRQRSLKGLEQFSDKPSLHINDPPDRQGKKAPFTIFISPSSIPPLLFNLIISRYHKNFILMNMVSAKTTPLTSPISGGKTPSLHSRSASSSSLQTSLPPNTHTNGSTENNSVQKGPDLSQYHPTWKFAQCFGDKTESADVSEGIVPQYNP